MRIARVFAFSAVVCMLLVVGFPALFGVSNGPVGSAEAGADVVRDFVVGVAGLTVDTLNPNVYTSIHEGMIIFPCYSTLLQYDEDSAVIGDLARSWDTSTDRLLWHFELVDAAYFCDPADPMDISHPVTADDVIFTYMSIQGDPASRLHAYLPGVISSMWAEGPFSLYIELAYPFAAFEGALTSVPILPQYIWEYEDLTSYQNLPPIGSGPFYYATDGIPTAGMAVLAKNPNWHLTEERGWSVRVDRWILKEEFDQNVAWLDLTMGNIDMMLNVNPQIFVNELPNNPELVGYSQNTGFVYEFNLNQMSDALRADLGGQFQAGDNNQLLLDPVVKQAIAMSVDKTAFVEEVLYGLGAEADSLVPPSSPWHYSYPDPVQFDPAAARQLLADAGWAYDITGAPATYDTVPLCKQGGEDPLSFRFCTLDTAVEWLTGARMIADACELSGVEMNLEVLSVTAMNAAWYAADYDAWLWDWVFSPLSDPASGILEVLTTDAIGVDSDVFCSIPEYDALYYESLTEMDPVARAAIIDEMQAIAYEDMACQCVAYKDSLYAASECEWTGFGDLNTKYMLLPDVSNLWISLNMYPHENPAPVLYSIPADVEVSVGESSMFSAGAVDDDPTTVLEYRWFWGDGTSSGWSTSAYAYHAYAESGVYTADVAVREATSSNGFDDFFVTSESFEVSVLDLANEAPVILEVVYEPAYPDTGTTVRFTASAFDAEGDPVSYCWDFGDGMTAVGPVVEHQFAAEGLYSVTLSVTDGILGPGRPVEMSLLVAVSLNSPPSVSVPDYDPVQMKTTCEFSVDAFDLDTGDTLMFTWSWGDGTVSVTYEPFATHAYSNRGFFTITVTVSDMTGLPGHEVSDSGTVYVYSGEKKQQGV